ncbi:unnamed protein product, partial [Meganyctiphanes norvegica]
GQVFTVDIENALAFIFNDTLIYNIWIKQRPNIRRLILVDYPEPPARNHLITFLGILNKYLKAPDHIHEHTLEFIRTVETYVQRTNSFNALELQKILIDIQEINDPDVYLSAWQPPVSCHNINPGGCYLEPFLASCGMWNMFHTLTVSANDAAKPLEVLQAMYGFMYNFFFCGECRLHFLNMYEQTIGKYGSVDTLDKSILWLWCTHNTVNQAWSLEIGNSWPPHPRFPLPLACPDCWGDTLRGSGPYTNCAKLFCEGNQGLNKCFSAKRKEDQSAFPRTYSEFSVPAVLNYLRGVYSGPYSKLNSRTTRLIINENNICPLFQGKHNSKISPNGQH